MNYTLRQLQVFLATAHSENITQAASTLAMSQSAASGALRELESQFDIQLFDRIGKRLQLNELGRMLRPQVESLLAQAEDLASAMHQHVQVGRIKIGATLTIGNYLAVELMAKFMREQEGAEASLDVANTATIAKKVTNFDLDVGLIEGEIQHPDLEVIPWCEDELAIFCSPQHPLAVTGKNISDKDLLAAQWILREQGSGTRQTFDRAMAGLLPELNVLLELQHTEAIKRAVEQQLGISCLSRIALKDAFSSGRLIELPIKHRDFHRHFYFILHKKKYRSAGVTRWLELCKELYSS